MTLYFQVWKRCLKFNGRATRSEYWLFEIVNILVLISFVGIFELVHSPAVDGEVVPEGPWFWLYLIFSTAMILPRLAVGVRRLHDSGKSGLWLLVGAVPLVGSVTLFVMMLMDSTKEDNIYGPYAADTGQPDKI